MAAPFASLARTGTWPILHLYASRGRWDGQLYRSCSASEMARYAVQEWHSLLHKIDNYQGAAAVVAGGAAPAATVLDLPNFRRQTASYRAV